MFSFLGLPFCVYVRVQEKLVANQTVQYLSVFLNCMNSCDFSNWSVDTRFELKIFEHITGKYVRFASFTCTFGLKTLSSMGNEELISYEDLKRPNCGYTKNDAVWLLVEMNADSVIRMNQELS